MLFLRLGAPVVDIVRGTDKRAFVMSCIYGAVCESVTTAHK
jgi:hypothetical protein